MGPKGSVASLPLVIPFSLHSNGAVCGALMGCKFGFQALPQDLLNFPYRGWLDDQVRPSML